MPTDTKKKTSGTDPAKMDDAAKEACDELTKNIKSWTAQDLTTWWSTWYMRAGHKRLGRILVKLARASSK